MLINELRDSLYNQLKEQYFTNNINKLFKISRTSHRKIILYLTNLIIAEGIEDLQNKQSKNPHKQAALAEKFAVVIINTAAYVLTFCKYTLLFFFFRIVLKGKKKNMKIINAKYIFINSAGGVDRLEHYADKILSNKDYQMVYLVTSHFSKLIKRSKSKRYVFLEPQLPSKNAVSDGFKLLGRGGTTFCLHVYRSLPFPSKIKRLRLVIKIISYLYSMIIYHHWAISCSRNLIAGNNSAIFVFDLDESSKELMLVDALQNQGGLTLLLQHGILTDVMRYIPSCHLIACSSKRERQALMDCGVEKNRIVAVGQPLQTLNDSIALEADSKPRYPLLDSCR